MKEYAYTITDPVGIHARPAGLLVKELSRFASLITVSRGADACDGKKLLSLMKLRIKQGETIRIQAEGPDEEAAVKSVETFLSAYL
jgi:phosphocarrier protein